MDSLLRVVGGISEYPGIESPMDTIEALDDYSMLICINEIIIK